jgi:hypothetical protein
MLLNLHHPHHLILEYPILRLQDKKFHVDVGDPEWSGQSEPLNVDPKLG